MSKLAAMKATKVEPEPVEIPPAPNHFSKKMKMFWGYIFSRAKLEAHQVLLLQRACEAFDSAERARRLVRHHGMLIEDRHGQLKPNPAVNIELASREQFRKLLGELHLGALMANSKWGL